MVAAGELNEPVDSIPLNKVRFHPHSFADPSMRLFAWKGGLYRAIGSERAAFFEQLFRKGVIDRWVARKLLIESEMVPLKLEGFELVVRHRPIAFVTYPTEWCADALLDAMRLMIDLSSELASNDLTIMDGHPWNVVFDESRPVYVDLGSILPTEGGRWKAFDEFRRYCYRPLVMMRHGNDRVARLLMGEDGGVTEQDFSAWGQSVGRGDQGSKPPQEERRVVDLPEQGPQQTVLSHLRTLRETVDQLESSTVGSTTDLPGATGNARWQPVLEILRKLRPSTVLDIGCGDGEFAKLAAGEHCHVVALDENRAAVSRLYRWARSGAYPITTLVMDFTKPTPARGLGDNASMPASERLACEMVIAFDVLQEFVSARSLNFDQIAEGLAAFASRWLLVNVPPRESIDALRARKFDGYSPDRLRESLARFFSRVDRVDSSPSPPCFLCTK